jgi:hypothetical protein
MVHITRPRATCSFGLFVWNLSPNCFSISRVAASTTPIARSFPFHRRGPTASTLLPTSKSLFQSSFIFRLVWFARLLVCLFGNSWCLFGVQEMLVNSNKVFDYSIILFFLLAHSLILQFNFGSVEGKKVVFVVCAVGYTNGFCCRLTMLFCRHGPMVRRPSSFGSTARRSSATTSQACCTTGLT